MSQQETQQKVDELKSSPATQCVKLSSVLQSVNDFTKIWEREQEREQERERDQDRREIQLLSNMFCSQSLDIDPNKNLGKPKCHGKNCRGPQCHFFHGDVNQVCPWNNGPGGCRNQHSFDHTKKCPLLHPTKVMGEVQRSSPTRTATTNASKPANQNWRAKKTDVDPRLTWNPPSRK